MIGVCRSIVAKSRLCRAISACCRRFSRSFGRLTSSRRASRASMLPNSAISSLAVFSPTPGTPGMLSELSPISPSTSMTPSGPTPKRSRTSATPRRWSFIVSRIVVCSVTSWQRSLSPLTSTTAYPSASKRRASVPKMSSASYPARCSLGRSKASTRRWMYGTCTARSSGIGGRCAL